MPEASDHGPELVPFECLLRNRADVFEIPRPQAGHGEQPAAHRHARVVQTDERIEFDA
jgi:hypothetical protein